MIYRKIIRNRYFNPEGKGVLLTKNRKLGLIRMPLRLFWRYEDEVEEDDYSLHFEAIIGSGWIWYDVDFMDILNTGERYFTFELGWIYNEISIRRGIQLRVRRMNPGPSRLMTFWLFGKKITLEVEEWQLHFLALIKGDESGRVTVNGEDRGIWP